MNNIDCLSRIISSHLPQLEVIFISFGKMHMKCEFGESFAVY